MAREMKDSGIAWIGEIPTEWACHKLKHFVKISAGEIISKEEYVDGGEFPIIGSNGEIGRCNKYNNAETVITTGRVGSVGTTHMVEKAWVTDNALIITVKNILPLYLFYIIPNFDFELMLAGTAQPLITATKLKNQFIPLPPVEKQEEIVSFLNRKCADIDTILGKIRLSIEEYKKLKQAIITQAVTKGVRDDRPMKNSGVEWIPSIPTDWDVCRGKHLFRETSERSETGGEELLTVSHITGITPRSQKNVNMFMSESLVGYKICHVGDIAANTMWMWQGAIGVSNYEGVISPSYNTYRQTAGTYESRYLDYLLRIRPLIDVYALYSTGITASRLRLYPEQFLSLRFIVPPLDEQEAIADYLDSKIREVDSLILKKNSILQK